MANSRPMAGRATLTAADMNGVLNEASTAQARAVPRLSITQEIGDTWIYGVASDPVKVARYREVMRLRKEWVTQGKFKVGDSTDLRLLQHLLLTPEHTWGVDTKR